MTLFYPRLCLAIAAGASMLVLSGVSSASFAKDQLKVAAIYTVPFEQQWVSRIHKALQAAQARGEIE
jgi:hypothetical protein